MPLRVALIAPPWFTVPPSGYGGLEWVVSNLAEGLVTRGHEVTLFASGGSRTRGRLVCTYAAPPSSDLGDWAVESTALLDAYRAWHEFDVIHDHTMLGLIAGANIPVPVVHTVHGPVIPSFHRFYSQLEDRVDLVAISHNQAESLPDCCRTTVIYNGVDTAAFPFRESNSGDYLLFVGRMNPDKGIVEAIEIARRAERRLVILAKVNESPERDFFDAVVRPALRGVRHELHLQVPHEMKVAAYQSALATLFPINWPEPFGLVMAESMACGTPVIAFPRGSVREVVADGETGFICNSVEEGVRAVEHVGSLDRSACRRRVETLFSAHTNVRAHEQLYMRISQPHE